MNLDELVITQIVLHDVPRGKDDLHQVTLTDAPIELDDQLLAYFRRKIVESLAARGLETIADAQRDPTVRNAVAEIVRQPSRLAEASKSIALRLDAAQTRRNPAGLLTVIVGRLDRAPCVSILKLEREQGLRFDVVVTQGGRATVNLQLLKNLTLTDKTKVFKTSLLVADSVDDPLSIRGLVSDDQRGLREGAGVAHFFLGEFLGCKPKSDAAVTTKLFAESAEAFFNERVPNRAKRGKYQVALVARLQDNDGQISPRVFAARSLEPPEREPFLAAVRDAGVNPSATFDRDTSMVKLERLQINFESGITVIGSVRDIDEHVRLPDNETGRGPTVIDDIVARMRHR